MKKWLVGILMALMISGCAAINYCDGKYDFSTYRLQRSAESLRMIEHKLYSIKTVAKLKDKSDGEIVEKTQTGIAFSVDGKHLIALKHVAAIAEEQVYRTPFGPVTYTYEKLAETYYLQIPGDDCDEGCEIELNAKHAENSDISILWHDEWNFDTLPGKIGNSDEIQVGQSLIVSRTPALLGHGFAYGIVAHPKYWEEAQSLTTDAEYFGFMLHTNLIGGDSGNPVFAIRDGKLELIGINQGTFMQMDMSCALKINFVMDVVNKLIEDK
ncbi:MAG: hypothetical protein GTN80_11635 [Nitrososphaeria archaeon]|nr:hypothetical protein [Nitrososphaeria archaeon]NIQ34267.1 hypothetical protein [Nitrososphaeria archaeon]